MKRGEGAREEETNNSKMNRHFKCPLLPQFRLQEIYYPECADGMILNFHEVSYSSCHLTSSFTVETFT